MQHRLNRKASQGHILSSRQASPGRSLTPDRDWTHAAHAMPVNGPSEENLQHFVSPDWRQEVCLKGRHECS